MTSTTQFSFKVGDSACFSTVSVSPAGVSIHTGYKVKLDMIKHVFVSERNSDRVSDVLMEYYDINWKRHQYEHCTNSPDIEQIFVKQVEGEHSLLTQSFMCAKRKPGAKKVTLIEFGSAYVESLFFTISFLSPNGTISTIVTDQINTGIDNSDDFHDENGNGLRFGFIPSISNFVNPFANGPLVLYENVLYDIPNTNSPTSSDVDKLFFLDWERPPSDSKILATMDIVFENGDSATTDFKAPTGVDWSKTEQAPQYKDFESLEIMNLGYHKQIYGTNFLKNRLILDLTIHSLLKIDKIYSQSGVIEEFECQVSNIAILCRISKVSYSGSASLELYLANSSQVLYTASGTVFVGATFSLPLMVATIRNDTSEAFTVCTRYGLCQDYSITRYFENLRQVALYERESSMEMLPKPSPKKFILPTLNDFKDGFIGVFERAFDGIGDVFAEPIRILKTVGLAVVFVFVAFVGFKIIMYLMNTIKQSKK